MIIYCLLGEYISPTTYWGNQKQLLTLFRFRFDQTTCFFSVEIPVGLVAGGNLENVRKYTGYLETLDIMVKPRCMRTHHTIHILCNYLL